VQRLGLLCTAVDLGVTFDASENRERHETVRRRAGRIEEQPARGASRSNAFR
jgi:hypothetical protein